MTDVQTDFRTKEAAQYLHMSIYALKRHLYEIHDLQPSYQDDSGQNWFTQSDLDAFRERKRRRGRPPVKGRYVKTTRHQRQSGVK